ncbi:MAG: hypothetical protein J0H98_08300 [Solirubrobacterales bacterium]|nr:hypothetical protein [Solirubrobacterales bacterium]
MERVIDEAIESDPELLYLADDEELASHLKPMAARLAGPAYERGREAGLREAGEAIEGLEAPRTFAPAIDHAMRRAWNRAVTVIAALESGSVPDRFEAGRVAGRQEAREHHPVQRDVEDFHHALDIPVGDAPAIRRPELRAELIREEAKETVDAILAGDLVEAIDGFCDLLCVVYGAAAEFGVNLAPFWGEVHRTNMAKQGGPVRADGKRLKPEGWTPPDIAGLLATLGSEGKEQADG